MWNCDVTQFGLRHSSFPIRTTILQQDTNDDASMPFHFRRPATLIAGLGALLLLTAAAPRPADAHAITDETPRIAIISRVRAGNGNSQE